jgi:bile acid-coenzyme A ligase
VSDPSALSTPASPWDPPVPPEVEPDYISYGARLAELAEAKPDEPALIFVAEDGTEQVLSWRTFDERSTQVARVLAEEGLGEGDLLAAELRNSPELLLAVFASWKVGATPVPVRWDLPDWELERVHAVIGAKVTVDERSGDLFERAAKASTERLPEVTPAMSSGICSSGSTGTPKVILRQIPAMWEVGSSILRIQESWGPLSPDQVVLTPGPIYHNNGFMVTSSILNGFTSVLMERFNAERAVDLIERYHVTGFTAATPMFHRIARVPGVEDRDFSSIEWTMQGAAVLPEWLAEFWFGLIGAERFYMTYGSSEGAGVVACRGDVWADKPGTLGKPWGGTELRIQGPLGEALAAGEVGEIYLRPPAGVTHHYLGDVPQSPVTDDGFTTIGDLGWVDEDGFVYMADRRVDMIVTGGANVFPAEIEAALSEHPAIADVVVIGLADEEWGRRVHAIVQPTDPEAPPTAAEVIAHAKARMAPYKVPKTVEFIDRIPRSEASKVNRATLIAEREPPAAT